MIEWQKLALCTRPGYREIFLNVDHRSRSKATRAAMAVCGDCQVMTECGTYADSRETTDGVWGGKFYGREHLYFRRARKAST